MTGGGYQDAMGTAYVVDAVRTPRGRGKKGSGKLSGLHPQELLAQALNGLRRTAFALAILTYISSWNEYFWALMVSYTDRSRVLTVALGVFKSQTPQTGPDWAGLMAATLVAALPMLLLFMVFAKRIVNSIGFSGIK